MISIGPIEIAEASQLPSPANVTVCEVEVGEAALAREEELTEEEGAGEADERLAQARATRDERRHRNARGSLVTREQESSTHFYTGNAAFKTGNGGAKSANCAGLCSKL